MTSVKDFWRGPARTMRSALRWQRAALRHMREPVPIFPLNDPRAPSGIKVHLGAGEINLQGWVNVDARPLQHIHSRTSSLALEPFKDGAIGAVYICHVLEHLSFVDADTLLAALHGKLMDGGVILISVPDFDALLRRYRATGENLDSIKHALMGGQGYEYNFHKSVYTPPALSKILMTAGYRDVQAWVTVTEFGSDIGDWSSAEVELEHGARIPLSLNLKARKLEGHR